MLLGQAFNLVKINQVGVAPYPVLDGIEPFARLRRRGAVGQMATGGQRHAHNGVTGLQQRHHHRAVGLGPGMGLDIDVGAIKQFFGALDRQGFRRINAFTTLVIAPAGIAFGVFVG